MPLTTNCPACREPLEVEEQYRTWKVRCPSCRHEFVPAPVEQASEEPVAEIASERPDSRGRRRRRDFDEDGLERAAIEVAGPALALKVVGWIGLLLSVLAVGIWILVVLLALNNPQARRNMGPQNDIMGQAALYITQGTIGMVMSIVMVIGSSKMARLQSHGWAKAAAIAGMIPCVSPCCLLGLPFGIWALTVLNRPEVEAAFRRNAPRRNSYEHGDFYD